MSESSLTPLPFNLPFDFFDKNYGPMRLAWLSGELWLTYKHPGGQYVTLREASDADLEVITALAARRHEHPMPELTAADV